MLCGSLDFAIDIHICPSWFAWYRICDVEGNKPLYYYLFRDFLRELPAEVYRNKIKTWRIQRVLEGCFVDLIIRTQLSNTHTQISVHVWFLGPLWQLSLILWAYSLTKKYITPVPCHESIYLPLNHYVHECNTCVWHVSLWPDRFHAFTSTSYLYRWCLWQSGILPSMLTDLLQLCPCTVSWSITTPIPIIFDPLRIFTDNIIGRQWLGVDKELRRRYRQRATVSTDISCNAPPPTSF